jgi:chromosome segregation ATPase
MDMTISKSRSCLLLAVVAILAGCGKQERMEAVQFAKALKEKQVNFTSANALEKDFVSGARAWCTGITTNGAGKGAELDQNSAVAAELAKSAVAISAQLSQVRQAIDSQSLKEEYAQSVRAQLTTQLTKRQRSLQDLRALLEQSAPQFLEYRRNTAYKGDTYPDGIGKLDALLQAHKAPDDVVGTALAGLKEKYSLSDSEI